MNKVIFKISQKQQVNLLNKEIIVYDFEEQKYIKVCPDNNFFSERTSYIKEQNKITTRYFVKEAVLKAIEQKGKLTDEIRNAINDSILSSSKIKDVRFMQLDVIQQ